MDRTKLKIEIKMSLAGTPIKVVIKEEHDSSVKLGYGYVSTYVGTENSEGIWIGPQ